MRKGPGDLRLVDRGRLTPKTERPGITHGWRLASYVSLVRHPVLMPTPTGSAGAGRAPEG